jgi:predicted transposase YdaD
LPGPWDSHLKSLMAYAAQDYLSWLIGDAIIDEDFKPDIDEELSPHLLRQINADSFYGFHIGSNKYAMHLEFQSRRDRNMARRLWEYNVIASCKFKRPIYSIVIFLQKDAVNTASPYIVYDHNGSEIHHFQFTAVKLWELPTEMVFEKRFHGLLPLAPLTREGHHRDVVEKMITGLQADNANEELFFLAYGLSSLAFEKFDDREWLEWRFRMLDEILNDSWAFQQLRQSAEAEGLKKGLEAGREAGLEAGLEAGREAGLAAGREEGRGEGLQRDFGILSAFVQARFPVLLPLAEECKRVIASTEILQQLVLDVTLAQSEDEARQHLIMALKK